MESKFLDIYGNAPKISKSRIEKEIVRFNEKYSPFIMIIKQKSTKANPNFSTELSSLNFASWHMKDYKYRTKTGVVYDDYVSDFMTFNSFLAEEAPFAMHVLNKSFEKINFGYSGYVVGTSSEPENIIKMLKDATLENRCRDYLSNLPGVITIENADIIKKLAKQYHIIHFAYNANHSVVSKLEKLSKKSKTI